MMKLPFLYLTCFSFFTISGVHSQQVIEWQKSLGGSANEECRKIISCSDGGYLVVGSTASNDQQVTGNHGLDDFWVVNTNATGELEWQQCFGGSGIEVAWDIQKMDDSSAVLIGQTESNNGQITGNHGNQDFWAIKLTNSGNIIWKECFGGTEYDDGLSIARTIDNKYILAGQSNSNDGQVSGNHGSFDFWVVKLADSGYIAGTGDGRAKPSFFNIYPNPSSGSFTLQLMNGSDNSPVDVTCFDMFGAKVFQQEFMSGRSHELALTDQAPGIYLLRVIQDGKTGTRKIIKQ